MTEKEAIAKTNEAIAQIKSEIKQDAIKEYQLPPLVNMWTGKTTGHAVTMQVSGKYTYNRQLMQEWMEKFGADDWNIKVNRSQLWLQFFVHYDKKKEDEA